MNRTRRVIFLILSFAFLMSIPQSFTPAQVSDPELERNFKSPPDSAKPQAWWHWMNGNVTKEGITADLEWMHRVGIAGMQMIDGESGHAAICRSAPGVDDSGVEGCISPRCG